MVGRTWVILLALRALGLDSGNLGFSKLGLPGPDGPLSIPVGGDGLLLSWPHLPSVGAACSVCFILLSCASLESCHLRRMFATKAVWAEGFSGSKEKPVP